MSAFVASLSELAALIFQSFRLPALLPAIAFTVANAALILSRLQHTVLGQTYYAYDQKTQALILAIFAALVAYLLSALNTYIIRWFEGYPLIEMPFRPGRWAQRLHQQNFQYLRARWTELETRRQEMRAELGTQRPNTKEYSDLSEELEGILAELSHFYPTAADRIVPTRLGNVIACAEDYPHALYSMDAVALWPLLLPTLTNHGFAKFVEREKGYFDFIINTLCLVLVLGAEMLVASWIHGADLSSLGIQLLVISIVCVILYRLSIEAALGWAATIRASFDLYRDHLGHALRMKVPTDFGDERRLWRHASAFYRDGRKDYGDIVFDYSPEAISSKLGTQQDQKEQES